MIKAYPIKDSPFYYLEGDKKSDTFYIKDKIKECGGLWNASDKHWEVTEEVLSFLMLIYNYIHKMIWVKTEQVCHISEEESYHWATDIEFKEGYIDWVFCGLCDSRCYHVKILGIAERKY